MKLTRQDCYYIIITKITLKLLILQNNYYSVDVQGIFIFSPISNTLSSRSVCANIIIPAL